MNGAISLDLKPYSAYRQLGQRGWGEVPAHWEVRRLGSLLRAKVERGRPDLPLLSVVREKGVVMRDVLDRTENHNYIPNDLSYYKVVRRGSFAMNKMKAWQGSFGVSKFKGLVSPAYFVFELGDVEPDFFHVAIRSRAYVPFFTQSSDGVRIGQWDLSPQRMRRIPFAMPPLAEQAAIAQFLGYWDQRGSWLVEAKEKLVELLEELNTSNISEVVTGKFDVRTGQPYPVYKPSGIQWLGAIPSHWDLVPLKRVSRLKSGVGFPISAQGDVKEELLFLKVSDMSLPGNEQWMLNAANTVSSEVAQALGAQVFRKHTIVFPKVGGALLTNKRRILARDACIDNNLMACVVAAADFKFIYYLLRWLDLGGMAKPGPVPAISEGEVKNMRIPLPSRTEQTAIVNYLAASTSKITAAIVNTRGEIELLEEFRTRLIADVVTGKLDVREAADRLEETAP